MQTAINAVTQGRTVITIAHRLSTIRDADQIASSITGGSSSWATMRR
ncbi:hypothetical protein [Nocardia sp. NPDC058114]